MIIRFDARIEGLGDVLCTDGASREDLEGFCVALADAFNQSSKQAGMLSWFNSHLTLAQKIADIVGVAGLTDVDRETAIDALTTTIAEGLAYNDKLSLKDIDDAAKKIGRKIAERARPLMFSGDNQIWEGPPFGIVDVDGIRLRFRAVGAPPAEAFELTKDLIQETRKNVRMDWVRRMPAEWLAEPLIAIRDPATGTAVVVDGHHRMVRLWLAGVRTARAYILSPQTYAPFLFKTFDEFNRCFQGGRLTKARLRVIFAPQKHGGFGD